MNTFENLVKQREQELISNNLIDLRKNIDNSDYSFKISNYCEKFHFNIKEIKEQILTNNVVASFFIKDPFKQNFVEKLVAQLLKTTTLPQQGKNCIRFTKSGDICSKKAPDTTKSVDFCINNIYITQKYTRNAGGMQDNQYKDVVDFLIKGSLKNKVAAILDGDYWDDKRNELKIYFSNNSNVSILSMNDILSGGFTFD